MFKWIMLFAGIVYAGPDLFAPMAVDVLDSSGTFFDKIQITTLVVNRGDAGNTPLSYPAVMLSVGIDSVHLNDHRVPATYVLNAGFYTTFLDTALVFKGRFSVNTQVDPLFQFGENGAQTLNNVRSQSFEFHPYISTVHDTTVVYDTLTDTLKLVEKDTVKINLHDTTRVTIRDTIFQRDTIRVVIRDTVIRVDTLRIGPPTLAKASSLAHLAPIASTVYNAAGVKVWEGMLSPGGYPPAGLRPGLHLIVQGGQARRFRVAYR